MRVRAAALEAVAALVKWAIDEPEVRLFRDLVPALMQARARAPHPRPQGHGGRAWERAWQGKARLSRPCC